MGFFWRNIDFEEEENYKRFSNLKVEYLYRWSKSSWSGEAGDFNLYVIMKGSNLTMGLNEAEMDEPKFFRVGQYQIDKKSRSFKEQIKKQFLSNLGSGKKYNPKPVKTREICNYMKWDIDDENIGDWIT